MVRRIVLLLAAWMVLSASAATGSALLLVTSVHERAGIVTVTGTASLPATAPKPLVADAGDSLFVQTGRTALLIGDAVGGTRPYSFAWTVHAGVLEAADAPAARLDLRGVRPGTHAAGLTVTDAAGARAEDRVLVVVHPDPRRVLADEEITDETPGVLGSREIDVPFAVPAGLQSLDLSATISPPDQDYDLALIDPDGAERTSSSTSSPTERLSVDTPEAGEWTARITTFLVTTGARLRLRAEGIAPVRDPRPVVRTGGPYRFVLGIRQTLSGSVAGGTPPLTTGWDVDGDGRVESNGLRATAHLPEGRHLVSLRTRDAAGLERRQNVPVLVASPERIALDTAAFSVIAVTDTGINPYHLEFSAQTYPDPDVLRLTNGFRRHPSEYIRGYPVEAEALPVSVGGEYLPPGDAQVWDPRGMIRPRRLYWIPGTKIIGAMDAGEATAGDTHPILDDDGHGDGSASVAAGNRFGYCPTCLLLIVEGHDESLAAGFAWVDITSHSYGYLFGLPFGLIDGPNIATRDAVERGQTVLFAAGNGYSGTFDAPLVTWGSDQTGSPWNIVVGATRRDNRRAVFGDGVPVHLSSWGDGLLPSACRVGTVGMCGFSGTSAATPYAAGVFGHVLTEIRRTIGDGVVGQRPRQVIAEGVRVPSSPFLGDARLTRGELRGAVLGTAEPLDTANEPSPHPYVTTVPYVPMLNVLSEGYGVATPASADRAITVLLGKERAPDRWFENAVFAVDESVKESLYGPYDRDGDGVRDSTGAAAPTIGSAPARTVYMQRAAEMGVAASRPGTPFTLYLHRRHADPLRTPGEPPSPTSWITTLDPELDVPACEPSDNERRMDGSDTAGDLEPCFRHDADTNVLAPYRPAEIHPAAMPLTVPLPAGSVVDAEIFMASEIPSVAQPAAVVLADEREIGAGSALAATVLAGGLNGEACADLGELCWTRFSVHLETDRPAFAGERLAFALRLPGTKSWAIGYEGAHASKVRVTPAISNTPDLSVTVDEPPRVDAGRILAAGAVQFPERGQDPSGAGDRQAVERVELAVDDPTFAHASSAALIRDTGRWRISLPIRDGARHIFVRAVTNGRSSDVVSAQVVDDDGAVVEWQAVDLGHEPHPDRWRPARGFKRWSFSMDGSARTAGSLLVIRIAQNGRTVASTTASPPAASTLPSTGIAVGDPLLLPISGALLALRFAPYLRPRVWSSLSRGNQRSIRRRRSTTA